jgi:hypothetical protein
MKAPDVRANALRPDHPAGTGRGQARLMLRRGACGVR